LSHNIKIDKSVLSVTGNKVVETSVTGIMKTKISVKLDNTLVIRSGSNQKQTLLTIPHPVISHGDSIIGDSYPMVGEIRVELGQNLISKIEWDYSLQTSGHDKQMLGISKKLQVNNITFLWFPMTNFRGEKFFLQLIRQNFLRSSMMKNQGLSLRWLQFQVRVVGPPSPKDMIDLVS